MQIHIGIMNDSQVPGKIANSPGELERFHDKRNELENIIRSFVEMRDRRYLRVTSIKERAKVIRAWKTPSRQGRGSSEK